MDRLIKFSKKQSSEKLLYKTKLLCDIERNLTLLSLGHSKQVSYEETYRLIFNYCIYFCEASKNGHYDNIQQLCNILDSLTFKRVQDVENIKSVMLYPWNWENRNHNPIRNWTEIRNKRYISKKLEELYENARDYEKRMQLLEVIKFSTTPILPTDLWHLVVQKVQIKTLDIG